MSGSCSHLTSDRRGAAIVEFAVLAPVLLTVLLGTADIGRMFYVRQGLEHATEEAARYYTLNPSATDVTAQLRSKMPGGMGPAVNVAYAHATSCNGNDRVTCTTITATYAFSFAAGYLQLGGRTLRATAKAVRFI
jgi:Flp pilus assembly protein TadG